MRDPFVKDPNNSRYYPPTCDTPELKAIWDARMMPATELLKRVGIEDASLRWPADR